MYGTWSEYKKGLPEQTSKKSQHWGGWQESKRAYRIFKKRILPLR